MLTLKIESMTINGHPNVCPECASEAYTLDGTGFIDALPVRGNCWQSHSWEEPLITLGTLKQIDAARTGREKAADADTFEIVIGGAVVAGVIHPEIVLDDLKVAGGAYWRRIAKPALRRKKRTAVRAVTQPVKNASRNAVASAKAAAIGAAWGLQAGGTDPDPDYTPEPVNPCVACSGKGRHKVESRIHGTTSVRCSVCLGTGEID
ncbi:hypothetical protein AB0I27_22725 [Streptomyces sp. NPDC050597]|uniref:hypothetical protein n=1 Tax=Streptomyces sp. NPDC050597 TaxID=3157212 RepID=UPI003428654F